MEKLAKQIREYPEWFFEEWLGIHLTETEKEIVYSIRDNRKTTVRSCHGSGKTFSTSAAALWFMYAFPPSVVIDTAPTDRQVRNQFWREFRAHHSNSKIPLGGQLNQTQFTLDENWYAIGFSTKETAGEDSADKMQGFHGKNMLFIIDEASGVHEAIFEAIDGALSGGAIVRLVYIGNPTRREGSFAKSFEDPDFHHITISAFDTPNFYLNGIYSITDLVKEKVEGAVTYVAGLANPQWALEMLRKYGWDSDVFRVRVRGLFPNKSSDTAIGIDLVEMATASKTDRPIDYIVAQERYKAALLALKANEEPPPEPELEEIGGLDVARYGGDSCALVSRIQNYAEVVDVWEGTDTMETTGIAKQWLMEKPYRRLHIDVGGMGIGVYDRLMEQPEVADRVFGVNSAAAATDPEHYVNLRAEGWIDVAKEWLKTAVLADHDGWLQLTKPKYKINSAGKFVLESKDEMKKRKVPSPDVGDALVLTLVQPTEGGSLDTIVF